MNKDQAQRIIKDTFENKFNKARFTGFIVELLNLKSLAVSDPGVTFNTNQVPNIYQPFINSFEKIADYRSGEHKLDVLVIRLKKETSIERARTMQRNFIAWYLRGDCDGEMKDAALAAFVSPNEEDWRFSLIKMDYSLGEDKKGRIKISEEFTPAKRWSFLVGQNEKSHTAQSQLIDILAKDEINPTLTQLEESFNIETVTKEFFKKYKELFFWTNETLDEILVKDSKIRSDFENKNINTVDFSKKLLGQIVFLYFLQKKGWFGVARDADWGTGPKNFLRKLFDGKHGKYKNFYNDILEPLFYEALRNDRSYDDDYYRLFNCKIPFLNGGLFDPINNYDWVHTDINLPNDLFSNEIITKERDKGTGILDIFDRYNFTVKEDEPLEKEVAVDPEMLGKVFENLLEVKDRKSKGTYYTPREIVHYMCQQSLINYLATEMEEKIPKDDVEKLIKYGEQFGENSTDFINSLKDIPQSIIQNAKLIDKKLFDIKVCDPAVGSGAFLVSIMGEIVRTRNVLSNYLKDPDRTIYKFKRECIENTLYGVDIDPGAIEIAKLRLWLSLVVDEEDIKRIKPLPNLDYKIVCGDSLMSIEKNLFNQELFSNLENLKKIFFDEINPNKKQEYKTQINGLINKITNGHREFDFEIYFSEIFHENDGFDVVIANPPYIRQEEIMQYKNILRNEYTVFSARSDLYTYFYEKGILLLKDMGFLSFITSNKFMRAKYGEKLRVFLRNNIQLLEIIDFGNVHKFEAITNTLILILKKQQIYNSQFQYSEDLNSNKIYFNQIELQNDSWTLADSRILTLKKKIEEMGLPLSKWNIKISYGIKTGYNEAFILNDDLKNDLIKKNHKLIELIKPLLRGRDIGRYITKFAGQYIIISKYQGHEDLVKKYPEIVEHLERYKYKLKERGQVKNGQHHWLELDNNPNDSYLKLFDLEKIIWIELSDKNKFTYTDKGEYILAGAFMITGESLKYLLAFLNSKLCLFYFNLICNSSGMDTTQWKKFALEKVPVIEIIEEDQKPLTGIVDKILAITKNGDYLENPTKQAKVRDYEKQIDQLVYKLYGITEEEIKIIEGPSVKE